MEQLHIPAITTLKSTDAVAIRQITLSLVEAIEKIKKDIQVLQNVPQRNTYVSQKDKNNGI